MAFLPDWLTGKKDRTEDFQPSVHNTDEENALWEQAEHRWQEARAGKVDSDNRDLHAKWRDLDKMYRGNQWKGPVPDYKSTPVLNFTFSLIEAVVPRMTDSRPEVLVLPRVDRKDFNLAKYLSDVQSYLWYSNKMQREIGEAVRMCMKYGTVMFKAIWDPDLLDGLGDVKYSVVHPMNFFPDPRARRVEDMEFCFGAVPKPLEYFARRWPEKGYLVESSAEWTETEGTAGSDVSHSDEPALLKEYWFRDEEGDLCVMYYANGVVLELKGGVYDDLGEPFYRHNRFPFVRMVNYPIDKKFWGMSEIEVIEILQRVINNFAAQIIDNTRLTGSGQWVVNKRASGLREEDAWMFNDRPDHVMWTNDGGVEKIPGTPIPSHIPDFMERMIFAMEQITGIHDVVQGRRPSGVRAASAIIALQEAANVRVRQKSRELEFALVDLAEMANFLVLEHYEEPRPMRLTGRTEIVTQDVREALTERIVDQAALAGLVEQGVSPEELPPDQLEELMREVKFPEFDVEVTVGASVPYSQALLYEQSKEFYQLGIVDRQAVLEATNFPGREEIIARMAAAEGQVPQEGGARERVGERTF